MIVLDASAATAIVRGSAEGKGLEALVLEGERAVAPDLFHCEMANVAWKYATTGVMDAEEARFLMDGALSLIDEFYPEGSLAQEACIESLRRNHPAYDMFYMVLARRTGATLFTLDEKLMRICRDAGVSCVDLAALPD